VGSAPLVFISVTLGGQPFLTLVALKITHNVCGHVFVAGIQSSKFSRYKKVRLKAPSFETDCPAIKYARCCRGALKNYHLLK